LAGVARATARLRTGTSGGGDDANRVEVAVAARRRSRRAAKMMMRTTYAAPATFFRTSEPGVGSYSAGEDVAMAEKVGKAAAAQVAARVRMAGRDRVEVVGAADGAWHSSSSQCSRRGSGGTSSFSGRVALVTSTHWDCGTGAKPVRTLATPRQPPARGAASIAPPPLAARRPARRAAGRIFMVLLFSWMDAEEI
jgi:hypothetical protein